MATQFDDEKVTGHLEHRPSNTHFYIKSEKPHSYSGYAVVPGFAFPVRQVSIPKEVLYRGGEWVGRHPMTKDEKFVTSSWNQVKETHFPRNHNKR